MRARLLSLPLCIFASATIAATAAHAEGPTAQASQLSDVIKLEDGSIFRGTITELVAKDHADITL